MLFSNNTRENAPVLQTLRPHRVIAFCTEWRRRGHKEKEKRERERQNGRGKDREGKGRKLNGRLAACSCLFSASRSRSDAWKISYPLKNPRESVSQGSVSQTVSTERGEGGNLISTMCVRKTSVTVPVNKTRRLSRYTWP